MCVRVLVGACAFDKRPREKFRFLIASIGNIRLRLAGKKSAESMNSSASQWVCGCTVHERDADNMSGTQKRMAMMFAYLSIVLCNARRILQIVFYCNSSSRRNVSPRRHNHAPVSVHKHGHTCAYKMHAHTHTHSSIEQTTESVSDARSRACTTSEHMSCGNAEHGASNATGTGRPSIDNVNHIILP